MPYIKQGTRLIFNKAIESLAKLLRENPDVGNVNYCITRLVLIAGRPSTGWNYASLHDVVGVLDDAKSEIRRRIMDPYENYKGELNGDILEFEDEEEA